MLLPWLLILPMFPKVAVVILVTIVANELSVYNITVYKTFPYVRVIVTWFLWLHQLKRLPLLSEPSEFRLCCS